jgi:hypothetical protein
MHAVHAHQPCLIFMAQSSFAEAPEIAHVLLQNIIERIEQTDGWQRLKKAADEMKSRLANFEAEKERLKRPRPGGSKKGRKIIRRDFVAAYEKVWKDYFAETPVYSDVHFRRRYRVSKNIFTQIYQACKLHPFFGWNANAAHKMGIHPIVKVTAVFRHLAYGISADGLDEHYAMSETTVLNARIAFCDVRLI